MTELEGPSIFTNKVGRWFFAVCILCTIYLAYRLVEPFLILPLFPEPHPILHEKSL